MNWLVIYESGDCDYVTAPDERSAIAAGAALAMEDGYGDDVPVRAVPATKTVPLVRHDGGHPGVMVPQGD